MKKCFALILIATMLLILCACGKSQAVSAAEKAIKEIGEITADSGDAIANAQKLYGILTDAEKEKVSNRLDLVEAQDAFDALNGDITYENAKNAYTKINESANMCISGMQMIYDAWNNTLTNANSINTNQLGQFRMDFFELEKYSGLDKRWISDGAKELGIAYGDWKDWSYAGYIVHAGIEKRGDYDTIASNMEEAGGIIGKLSESGDSTYYPKLNDYYSAVYSYFEFFKNPSGNLEQISETMSGYEKDISSADAGFLFYK